MRRDIILDWLKDRGRGESLSEGQLSLMARYQEMVLSAKFNLTAIRGDEDFAVKHFVDSLSLLPWVDKLSGDARVIDVGTGAGFPGVPIKIARPRVDITLLDSLLKRVHFLRGAVAELGFEDVECIHARAEEHAKRKGACYDMVVARAVARLNTLVEYALPLVKPGGLLLAMKGPDVSAEIKDAMPILDKLGGVVREVETVEISRVIRHTVVVIAVR